MKMTFVRIEKGFDGPGYSAVFSCEDTVGGKPTVWEIKYGKRDVLNLLPHPHLGPVMRQAIDAFPEDA
ncbi:MAG: hypothetical protein HQL33_07560 [Alphaproteobacteria bacterium]|nr:hypothetical protein [Alphaproteobacteria bacterium]MBF0129834.1 hypothetical protein [Alphaproteobacteria bacterium]